MLNKLLKQASAFTIVFALTTIITRAINFLFLPIIVAKLDLGQLGMLELINTFFSFSTTILCSFSATGMIRFYYFYQDDELKQSVSIGVSFIIGFLTSCIAAPIILYFIISQLSALAHSSELVILASTNIGLFCLFSLVTTYLRISEQLYWYLGTSIAQNIIAIFSTIFLLHNHFGVASCLWGVFISCIPFVPVFFYLLAKYFYFSLDQLRKHLTYVLPLVLYGILFSYFICIDKILIAHKNGLALLGIYSLLWRFGQIFVICSQALMDAWPMIIYKVHNEQQSARIISKLITYCAACLCYLGIGVTFFSTHSSHYLLPRHAQEIIRCTPLFFIMLVCLDLARLGQTIFNLINQTIYIPIIACGIIIIQTTGLTMLSSPDIFQLLLINSGAFCTYFFISIIIGNRVYQEAAFDYYQLSKLLSLTFILNSSLWFLGLHYIVLQILLVISFPLLLWWSNVIDPDDKNSLKLWIAQAILKYAQKNKALFTHKDIIVHEHSYTKNIHNQRVLILGPTPPPLGGISVHISRSATLLKSQGNTIMHLDTIKRPWPFFVYIFTLIIRILTARASFLMYHTTYSYRGTIEYMTITILAKLMRASCIIVDHDPRYLYQKNTAEKTLLNALFLLSDYHVIIGSSTYKSYQDNTFQLHAQISIESSFIPPHIQEKEAILSQYPNVVHTFIQNHWPLIAVNAFSISKVKGTDLYGIDLCIKLLKNLKHTFENIGLIIAYVEILDRNYLLSLEALIEEYNVSEQLFMFKNNLEFWPIIDQSNLFIRPTRSDSLGISISEALYLNIPAIASDVCTRPPGTILFKNECLEDLTKITLATLKTLTRSPNLTKFKRKNL